jgi:hypothetical protein
VSYRVVFAAGAAVQYHELPASAQDAVIARVVDLADAPWDAAVLPPGDMPSFRETSFGDGRGLIDFYVDDASEVLRIFNLVWIG